MARPRLITDEAILDAVRRCAIERGAGVPLDAIAERLGVTGPAILRRFGSREQLLVAALRPPDAPPWVRDLDAGPDERPLAAQLASIFERVLDYCEREVPVMSARRECGIPIDRFFDRGKVPPPVAATWALAAWLERARARRLLDGDEDFETTAVAMLGALQVRAFLAHCLPRTFWRRSREQFLADLSALYARALAPKRRRAAATPRRSARRPTRGSR